MTFAIKAAAIQERKKERDGPHAIVSLKNCQADDILSLKKMKTSSSSSTLAAMTARVSASSKLLLFISWRNAVMSLFTRSKEAEPIRAHVYSS